jgi:diaminopimelate decarboxylase
MSQEGALLSVRAGHLVFDGVDLVSLAERLPTPFFVFSERQLRANVTAIVRAFRSRHAATDVFYASKACSNLWVLDEVRRCGIGVEVNSRGELRKALRSGFGPREIVFNGVAKTREEIDEAVRAGVHALVVDSLYEIDRIAEVAAASGAVARVAPRFNVDVPTLTHPGLETAHGGKAGIDRDDSAVAFRRAAASELAPVGLHVHIGSQITSVEPYRRALAVALELVDEAEAAIGARLEFIDVGGGFAVPYREAPVVCHPADYFCSRLTMDDYAAAIGGEVERRRPDLRLALEPGRSIAATSAVLVSRVENEKTQGVRDARGRRVREERWITVDAGFNTLLEHQNYAWYFRAVVASRADETPDTEFRLAGPLCDGGDVFVGDGGSAYRALPSATTVGDVVAFLDVGAYSLETQHPYNARPRAAAYAVLADGRFEMIRRPDSDEDLVAHDLVPAPSPIATMGT